MADSPRDLTYPDLWAASLERSLERRCRSRRASTHLWTLREPRDLTDAEVLGDSLARARSCRAAAERQGRRIPAPAVRGLSLLGVLAVSASSSAEALASGTSSLAADQAGSLAPSGDVAALQRALGVAADGTFGPVTAGALRAFQRARGLSVDGVAGPATRAALGLGSGPLLRAGASAPLAQASSPSGAAAGGGVAALQAELGVPADGAFGPATGRAVRAFQASHGLTADGVVGPSTRADMGLAAGSVMRESGPAPAEAPGAPRVGPRTSSAGASGSVAALQRQLGLSADGVFGPRTARAIKDFQAAHGLGADALIGPSTRVALGWAPGPVLRAPKVFAAPAPSRTSDVRGPASASPAQASGAHASALRTPTAEPAAHGSPTPAPASSSGASSAIGAMVSAGDQIATRPYVYGGGHGSFSSSGYDCSGSVSYVLHAAGLLGAPEDSGALMSYGAPGPGAHVTIYANAGHAYMTIDGRRFDTVALQETGSRWSSSQGESGGYVVRHPVGM